MSSFSLKIDNNNLPPGVKVESKSLNIKYSSSGTRGVLNFTLIDENLSGTLFYFTALIGKLIEVYEDGVLIYGGKLDAPKTRKVNQLPITKQKIYCVDHHEICDRITINQSYHKQEISLLIKSIIDNYLASDGIWYDNSSINTTLYELSINCPRVFCTDALNEIANYIGWQWYIGPDKKFYFNDRTAAIGPTLHEFNSPSYLVKTLVLDDNMDEYCNRVIIKDVNAVTLELTEAANPNPNSNRSYYVRFKINRKPLIYVTTNRLNPPESDLIDPRYVGINGIDTNMQWYWEKDNNLVTQDSNETLLTAGVYVVLKYYGQYQIDIVEENSAEIANRAAIEGGSGVYERIEPGVNIEGILIAEEKAQALLNKYGRIMRKITVSSKNHDWKIGQICDTVFPTFNINSLTAAGNGYLVQDLMIKDDGTSLTKTVTLIDGESDGGWINFYKEWMKKVKNFEIREDALVEVELDADEITDWAGTIVINSITALYPEDDPGGLYPSNLLYPGTINATKTIYD